MDDIEEARAYRRALGSFATGVAVITTKDAQGAPWAITVNSFASVSLKPRLVLWSIDDSSDRYALFSACEKYGVNILATGQEALSARYAARGAGPADPGEVEEWPGGAPRLKEALARFDCRVYARHAAGDHMILIGEVKSYDVRPGAALTFFQGRYGAASLSEG